MAMTRRGHAAEMRRRTAKARRYAEECLRKRMRAIAFAMLTALATALCATMVTATPRALADAGERPSGCLATMDWPLRTVSGEPPALLEPFQEPPEPWLAGHRGVDLQAVAGDMIRAPADGMIAFSGRVGGKDVVSVRHGMFASTFEPAVSDLAVGATVARGSPFATVSGHSDHCDGKCLHWGIRWGVETGKRIYRDPAEMAGRHRIVIKSAESPRIRRSDRHAR